ncbi:MAG TPA: fibronectin type III domain-containing protein [Thermoanaerobaculia bacterium]|nr:fibronectin type III domain-containing protein [Thermoanaerobaculia bacterium]
MHVRWAALAALFLTAVPAAADPAPLTNVRYINESASPLLRSNGREVYAFWAGQGDALLAARVSDAVPRAGHAVSPAPDDELGFDVAWTGTHFLSVRESSEMLWGRFLDAAARPVGEEFAIGEGHHPAIAASPAGIVVAHLHGEDNRARDYLLAPDGRLRRTLPPRLIGDGVAAVAAGESTFALISATSGGHFAGVILMDADGDRIATRSLARQTTALALATDGTRYLIVRTDTTETGPLLAELLDGDGNLGPTLLLDGDRVGKGQAFVSWNGNGWTVAYNRNTHPSVVYVDAAGRQVLGREESAHSGSVTSAVAGMVSWDADVAMASRLPFAANEPVAVARTASEQRLLAATASQAATLVLWADGQTLRAGLRTHDGQWSERELSSRAFANVAAASDGREFVVLAEPYFAGAVQLFRLDPQGNPMGEPVTLASAQGLLGVAWDGTQYALFYGYNVRFLHPRWGLDPRIVRIGGFPVNNNLAVATNGSSFVVAGEQLSCAGGTGQCRPIAIHRHILRADLGPAGAPAPVSGPDFELAGAIVNGNYVVVQRPYPSEPATAAAMPGGSYAVAFGGRVEIRDSAGVLTSVVPTDPTNRDRPRLVRLGDRLLWLGTTRDTRAPYYGANRVVMQFLDPVPPAAAPAIGVTRAGGQATVAWSVPTGSVHGYRIEWRADNAAWTEVEEWFPVGTLQATIPIPEDAARIAVRVRAINDGGASAYSNEAVLTLARRRRTSG